MSTEKSTIFDSKVLGHPAGLFVLFFTEMWERFSYYGMRALLVLFLISAFGLGGWNWPAENALALYGTYTALVYITPIIGGFIADRFIGYKKAVVLGAIIMTAGHASMAIETHNIFLYIGIGLLIVGNGFFKPNMTSIISHMYKDVPEKKDGAYTIFYMGVNAGAFLGILLCGYIGEKVGWSYGFGIAGIFMFLGMLQFYFSRNIFGKIGDKPEPKDENTEVELEFEGDKLNPFTPLDRILVVLSALIAVIWVINDPLSKIGNINLLLINEIDYSNHFIITGLILFFILLVSRILRYPKVSRDRMLAIVIFAVMTVVFWMSFEQAGGSMTIFASDFTDRVMAGNYYYIYLIVNVIITIVPVGIISWVLIKLFKQTFAKYKLANVILGSSFLIIWGVIFWMINRDLNSSAYVVNYEAVVTNVTPEQYNLHPDRKEKLAAMLVGGEKFKAGKGEIAIDSVVYNDNAIILEHSTAKKVTEKEAQQEKFNKEYQEAIFEIEDTDNATVYYHEKADVKTVSLNDVYFESTVMEAMPIAEGENIISKSTTVIEPIEMKPGDELALTPLRGKFKYLSPKLEENVREKAIENNTDFEIIKASVNRIKENEVEIPATWFLILNSLFIITFAPLFSKWWESKLNPSASVKYGLGLILLGIGFGSLALGSTGIEAGAKTASVSMIWLVFAYLFHTLGELCLSPVALSYVSKLVPGRMIAMMFGVWYIAIAIGNKLAGILGGEIEEITKNYDMTTFFLIFTIVPVVLGLLGIALNPIVKKLMHGVK